jgi:hypothetical protein
MEPALEAGAAEVTLFVRRSRFPQVNKSKWAAFPGFLRGPSPNRTAKFGWRVQRSTDSCGGGVPSPIR